MECSGRPPRPGESSRVSNWAAWQHDRIIPPFSRISTLTSTECISASHLTVLSIVNSRVAFAGLEVVKQPFTPSSQSGPSCSVIAGCIASSLVRGPNIHIYSLSALPCN